MTTARTLNLDGLPKSPHCHQTRHVTEQRAAREELRYWPCTILGSGTYGCVFQSWDVQTQQHVAVKQFYTMGRSELPQSTLRELAILKRCEHPNIMPVLDVLFDTQHREFFGTKKFVGGFVMPICEGGDLGHWLKVQRAAKKNVTNKKKCSLARQLLEAVCYMHQRSIVHRDIKPYNCMVNSDASHLLLSDLGLGRQCTLPLAPSYSGAICTLLYRPPEILMGSRSYGFEVDIWASGVTIAQLYTVDPPFVGDHELGQLWEIFRVLGTPTEETWPGVSQLPFFDPDNFPRMKKQEPLEIPRATAKAVLLIESMIQMCPSQRISAKRALEHPFFASIPSASVPSASAFSAPASSVSTATTVTQKNKRKANTEAEPKKGAVAAAKKKGPPQRKRMKVKLV